jgi:hypothetical protein
MPVSRCAGLSASATAAAWCELAPQEDPPPAGHPQLAQAACRTWAAARRARPRAGRKGGDAGPLTAVSSAPQQRASSACAGKPGCPPPPLAPRPRSSSTPASARVMVVGARGAKAGEVARDEAASGGVRVRGGQAPPSGARYRPWRSSRASERPPPSARRTSDRWPCGSRTTAFESGRAPISKVQRLSLCGARIRRNFVHSFAASAAPTQPIHARPPHAVLPVVRRPGAVRNHSRSNTA